MKFSINMGLWSYDLTSKEQFVLLLNDLVIVVKTWPDLPAPIRVAILAMVKTFTD